MRSFGMSEQQVEQVWAGFRAAESLSRIGRREGVPLQHVRRYLNQHGGVRPLPAARSPRQLTAVQREEISRGAARGESFRVIAARLGCARTTVSREVGRNGGREAYRAAAAEVAAFERACRPKVSKLHLVLDQVGLTVDVVVGGLFAEGKAAGLREHGVQSTSETTQVT